MTAEEIRALPIHELDLPSGTRWRVVEELFRHSLRQDPSMDDAKWTALEKVWDERLEQYAHVATVEKFISYMETTTKKHERVVVRTVGKLRDYYSTRREGAVMLKLIDLGMNFLDWNFLPLSTITVETLKKMKKEDLLPCSVYLLGALSGIAVDRLAYQLKKEALQVTVADLLATDPECNFSVIGWADGLETSLQKTREVLREIGFQYEDGPFLQHGTRRSFVESLMEKDALAREIAETVATLAVKRGWVKPFIG